jgi:hypothetical protein
MQSERFLAGVKPFYLVTYVSEVAACVTLPALSNGVVFVQRTGDCDRGNEATTALTGLQLYKVLFNVHSCSMVCRPIRR